MTTQRLRRRILTICTLCLTLSAPVGLGACNKAGNMTELETPSGGVQLEYALTPGSIFVGSISSKRSDGSVGGNQSTRKLDLKTEMTVMGQREDGATQVQVKVTDIVINWVVPNMPVNLDDFTANAKQRLTGMKIDMFLSPTGEVVEFPDPPGDLPQEDQFLMELVLDGIEQAFYEVPEKPLQKGESIADEKERGRKGKLGRYYKETSSTTFKGVYKPNEGGAERVALLDVDAERIETITTKEGGHETKFVDDKKITFDIDANFLASMEGKRTKYDAGEVSRIEFRASWAPTQRAAKAATVKQKIVDPCDDDYVGGEDCTDPCSTNYMGDAACESPAEGAADGAAGAADGAAEGAAEGAADAADGASDAADGAAEDATTG